MGGFGQKRKQIYDFLLELWANRKVADGIQSHQLGFFYGLILLISIQAILIQNFSAFHIFFSALQDRSSLQLPYSIYLLVVLD